MGHPGLLRCQQFFLFLDVVLAADQTAWVLARRDVPEPDVMWQGTEEWDSISDENGHAGDDETLNQSCAQELLNCDSTVDVEVVGTAGGQACNDIGRSSCHVFHDASYDRRKIDRAATQDYDALVAVGPRLHGQNGFESFAADHDGVDGGYEFVVAVGFASAFGQKVERAIGAGDEAVEAGADEDGSFHSEVYVPRGLKPDLNCHL
jgi:hypothetical protein